MSHALTRRRGGASGFIPSQRMLRRLLAAAAAFVLLALAILSTSQLSGDTGLLSPLRPVRAALETAVLRGEVARDVAGFYEARDYRPLWVASRGLRPFGRADLRHEAAQLPVRTADPAQRARLSRLLAAARGGDPAALARADVALSQALAGYAAAQRRTVAPAALAFIDPALAPPRGAEGVLEEAAAQPSIGQAIAALDDINPVYRALRDQLAAYRAQWSHLPQIQVPDGAPLGFGDAGARVGLLRQRLGLPAGAGFDERLESAVRRFQAAHGLAATGEADAATVAALNAGAAHYEALIAANLERARALPPLKGHRYVLVNVAARELSYHHDGQADGSMRIIAGTRSEPTPMMAGLITHLVMNPSWEIPQDMVRGSIAPKILRLGAAEVDALRLQVLSDWGDQPIEVDAHRIDWQSVADGSLELRVRQRPGGDNMMGRVKFMLPNELGIYLHDTPDKASFGGPDRLMSAGCIRLEQAPQLVAWLLGGEAADAGAAKDQRVDLDEATPVYITYLTAAPGPAGVTFHPDVYGRDPALLAAMGARHERR